MTRRFVALGLEPAVRRALERQVASVRARFPEHAWTDPEGWHLTLAFVGELSDARVPALVGAVADATRGHEAVGGSAQLRLGSCLRLGPRVLTIAVEDDPPGRVIGLGERVQAAVAAAGLPVQQRTVRPHLTVARARRRRDIDETLRTELHAALAAGRDEAAGDPFAWSVTRLEVWSSQLGTGPARYEVLATLPLSA